MTTKTKKTSTSYTPKKSDTQDVAFLFNKEKYIILTIGLVFIVVGFILMTGGGAKDPYSFNPEIFSFRRITLAPILILIGYAIGIYAIMKKPKDKE